jgi:chemotaxis protein CheZ
MTEQAASRVLNATDVAKPIQDRLQSQARMGLSSRWDRCSAAICRSTSSRRWPATPMPICGDVPKQTEATNEQLMEIMMAQDFQDLTGQVIKKIVDLAQGMETQLLQVLIEAMPRT